MEHPFCLALLYRCASGRASRISLPLNTRMRIPLVLLILCSRDAARTDCLAQAARGVLQRSGRRSSAPGHRIQTRRPVALVRAICKVHCACRPLAQCLGAGTGQGLQY